MNASTTSPTGKDFRGRKKQILAADVQALACKNPICAESSLNPSAPDLSALHRQPQFVLAGDKQRDESSPDKRSCSGPTRHLSDSLPHKIQRRGANSKRHRAGSGYTQDATLINTRNGRRTAGSTPGGFWRHTQSRHGTRALTASGIFCRMNSRTGAPLGTKLSDALPRYPNNCGIG